MMKQLLICYQYQKSRVQVAAPQAGLNFTASLGDGKLPSNLPEQCLAHEVASDKPFHHVV